MKLLRIVPDNTSLSFMKWRYVTLPISAALCAITILLTFLWSFNFGVDFTSGTVVEMRANKKPIDLTPLRKAFKDNSFEGVEIQEIGEKDVLLHFPLHVSQKDSKNNPIVFIKKTFSDAFTIRRIETIGPRVSGELIQSGALGIALSLAVVFIFLWIRFEWDFAAAAALATLHDLVLTFGFFAITRIEFNMTSIAAILTIIGYSLNDTVVVFDRIRELRQKYKRKTLYELIDLAINQTLARTFLVSFTSILALAALVIFGGDVIASFSWAMLFGIVVGTYSSIFIAAILLAYLSPPNDENKIETAA